jgi:hypothetical protein
MLIFSHMATAHVFLRGPLHIARFSRLCLWLLLLTAFRSISSRRQHERVSNCSARHGHAGQIRARQSIQSVKVFRATWPWKVIVASLLCP